MADTSRELTATSFAVQYNNAAPFRLKNFSGLLTSSRIIPGEPKNFIRSNSIQALEYQEVLLTLPFPLDNQALQLFDGVMSGRLTSIFTTIHSISADGKLINSFDLGNCLISEISFPELDAASRDGGDANITLKPQHIDVTLDNGSRSVTVTNEKSAKRFIASSYSLTIDNVPTNKVSKITSLAVQPHLHEAAAGAALDFVEFKTIQITLRESDLNNPSWQSWLNDFAKNQQIAERNGTLKFLSPDLKSSLLEISLNNIFIVSTIFHGNQLGQVSKVTLELMFDVASIATKIIADSTKVIRSSLEITLPPKKELPVFDQAIIKKVRG
jgi:hypothetical protein